MIIFKPLWFINTQNLAWNLCAIQVWLLHLKKNFFHPSIKERKAGWYWDSCFHRAQKKQNNIWSKNVWRRVFFFPKYLNTLLCVPDFCWYRKAASSVGQKETVERVMSSHQCHGNPLVIKQGGPGRLATRRASCLIGWGIIIASNVIKDST